MNKQRITACLLGVIIIMMCPSVIAQINQHKVTVRKIWDDGQYNAFTSLIYFKGDFYCSFRQGSDHVGGEDGTIRIIKSGDGKEWEAVATIEKPGFDLRDSKLSVTPDGKIMVMMGGAVYENKKLLKRVGHVSFSDRSGKRFTSPQPVNVPAGIRSENDWLWNVTWHDKVAYGVLKQYTDHLEGDNIKKISLLKSSDGINYELVKKFDEVEGNPNETTVRFAPDGEMFLMVRRDIDGLWGRSQPPYKAWEWVNAGMRFGGPDFAPLNEDLFIAGTRVYAESQQTGIFLVNKAGQFREILRLPSGGDTSYPGFVVQKEKVFVSYYSSHEEGTSIYFAEIPMSVIENALKPPPMVEAKKIWDKAPHNAFTDLVRFKGKFYCTFREGQTHVSGNDGSIRVIVSEDGENWKSAALIQQEDVDLRDPKLSVMPNGKLMLVCGGSVYDGKKVMEWHTRVMYSEDGTEWTPPLRVKGIPANNWIFGITWVGNTGYVAPRICGADPETGEVVQENTRIIVYKTSDGLNYEQVSDDLTASNFECAGGCGESSVQFKADSTMVVIVRIPGRGKLLFSKPPYKKYSVVDIQHGMGGPDFMQLSDKTWVVGTREYLDERPKGRDGKAMVLLKVDENGIYERLAELPSGGDNSYPGMVEYDGNLWVSYYSSHEEKTSIYLAKIPLSQFSINEK